MAGQQQSFALDNADGRWATFVSQDGDRLVIPKTRFNQMEQPRELKVEVSVPNRGTRTIKEQAAEAAEE